MSPVAACTGKRVMAVQGHCLFMGGTYRRLGLADFARPAHRLRNLVAIASTSRSIHDIENSRIVRDQFSLGQMPSLYNFNFWCLVTGHLSTALSLPLPPLLPPSFPPPTVVPYFQECLPTEVLVHIFSFLRERDLCSVGQVCQRFYEISNLEPLW